MWLGCQRRRKSLCPSSSPIPDQAVASLSTKAASSGTKVSGKPVSIAEKWQSTIFGPAKAPTRTAGTNRAACFVKVSAVGKLPRGFQAEHERWHQAAINAFIVC